MRLAFCVACGATGDLQHHHLIPKKAGGSDDETNLITLCTACHHRIHDRRMQGEYSHSALIKTGLKQRADAGITIGRPSTDPALIAKMRDARKAGQTYRSIAIAFGIGEATVWRHTKDA